MLTSWGKASKGWLVANVILDLLPDAFTATVCVAFMNAQFKDEIYFVNAFKESVTSFLQLFTCAIVGSMSDKYGRKPMLAYIALISIVVPLALAVFWDGYIYLGATIVSSMIGFGANISLYSAYAADVSSLDDRAATIGLVFGGMAVCFSVIPFIGSLAQHELGSRPCVFIACGLKVIHILFVWFVLPESHIVHPRMSEFSQPLIGPVEGQGDGISAPANAAAGGSAFAAVRKYWMRLRESILILVSSRVAMCMAIISFFTAFSDNAIKDFILNYLMKTFQLSQVEASTFTLVFGASGLVVQGLLLPLLSRYASDVFILLIAQVANYIHCILYGIATTSSLFFYSISIAALGFMGPPAAAAILSQTVPKDRLGGALGGLASLKAISGCISPLVLSYFFSRPESFPPPFNMPGLGFLVASTFVLISTITSIVVFVRLGSPVKKVHSNEIIESEDYLHIDDSVATVPNSANASFVSVDYLLEQKKLGEFSSTPATKSHLGSSW